MLAPWKKSYDKPRQHILKQRHPLANKGPYSQSYSFSSSHIRIWELDHKGWAPKNWCFWTVELEKMLDSLLDCKKINSVNPKGNQSWIFIARTHAEAETPLFWSPDMKSWFIGKEPSAGKDWGKRNDKGLDGWMASLTQQTWIWANWGDSGGQRSLARCSPWGLKELYTS